MQLEQVSYTPAVLLLLMAERSRLSRLRLVILSWVLVTVLVLAWWISGHDTYKRVSSLYIKPSVGDVLTETPQHHTTVNKSRQHWSKPFSIDKVIHGRPQNLQLSQHDHPLLPTLPPNVISGVTKFVFFVGYPKSGHSIIGSLLDAHPNVIIAHEYDMFKKLPSLIEHSSARGQTNFTQVVEILFNELYQESYTSVFQNGTRSENKQGFNLTLDDSWQGRYKDQILVIGDKKGGGSADLYAQSSAKFQRIYNKLLEMIQIPVVVFHCVRNPFDIIATKLLSHVQFRQDQKYTVQPVAKAKLDRSVKFRNDTLLHKRINSVFKLADSVSSMTNSVFINSMVVEVHNHELVSDPERTMHKLCQSLGIVCSPSYVRSCARKVFPKVSRTRFVVEWPEDLKLMVEHQLENYPFFKRYSFNSSI